MPTVGKTDGIVSNPEECRNWAERFFCTAKIREKLIILYEINGELV